jgi:3-oxoadipate enol-lactonase
MGFARVTAADGISLHAEVEGTGPTVLLVQGLGYATWAWARQLPALSTRFQTVVFDNRGAGRSDKPNAPYTIELMAQDAGTVVRQLGSVPADVVGFSMGGYIALTLASVHPDAVRSLVLIGTSCGGSGSVGVPEATREVWKGAAALSPAGFARATMPLAFSPGWVDDHPDEFEELLSARIEHPTPASTWRRQYEACEAFLAQGIDIGSIPHPTLVVHGTADRIVPYENAELLERRLAKCELARLDGAGHLALIERADEVNRLVVSFLENLAAS